VKLTVKTIAFGLLPRHDESKLTPQRDGKLELVARTIQELRRRRSSRLSSLTSRLVEGEVIFPFFFLPFLSFDEQ
jgi:hypothetical protein